MDFIKKNTWIIYLVAFGALVIFTVSTSTVPEGDLADTTDKNHVDYKVQGDIIKKKLSKEDKKKLAEWKDTGFIVKFDKFSHEIWVDKDRWYQLGNQEKRDRILTISNYFKEFDGTSQIAIFRNTGEQKLVAEYIARKYRFYEE